MKKPAASFLSAGLFKSCDDDNMPVICPTCQILFAIVIASARDREQRQEKPLDYKTKPATDFPARAF
jgi:hypothetical protein